MGRSAYQSILDDSVAFGEETPCILEDGQRLSRSILWDLQRNYFDKRGMEAWRQGEVPHYITSNPFIANAYAIVVLGFIRDCRAVAVDSGNSATDPLDPEQPISIIELGSGPGRFGYHFLNKFTEIYRHSVLNEIPFRYIMTDYSRQNIEFWRRHPSLKPFLEQGILDFARFDPLHDREMNLAHCGQTLSPGVARNPMVFISNYFFDSIPMDAFHIKGGKLYESLVRISSPQREPDPTDPLIISRMNVSYEHRPTEVEYYDDAEWNRILRDYTQRLADTTFLFPTGALECIRNLGHLSGGRMLLLSADRGDCRENELQGRGEPRFAVHGSFSLRVNYHAIGQYVVSQGGTALQPGHRPDSLIVSAFLWGSKPGGCVETRQAYEKEIKAFGPDDFFTLKKGIQEACEDFSIGQLLAFLRWSGYDAKILISCFSTLMRRLKDAGDARRREVYSSIQRVWSAYYPLGEDTDIAFHLGTLLCQMRYYREALGFFQHSIRLYGHARGTDFNMALCYDGLGETEKALECNQRVLELDPNFEPARALRVQIESSIGQKGRL